MGVFFSNLASLQRVLFHLALPRIVIPPTTKQMEFEAD